MGTGNYNKNDLKSFLIHEALFQDCAENPQLVSKARSIAMNWIDMHGKDFSPYWQSWVDMMDSLSWSELRDFALGDSDTCVAHRQSSPFSCCLDKEQRKQIRKRIQDEYQSA